MAKSKRITLADKRKIYAYHLANPEAKINTIADHFGKQWHTIDRAIKFMKKRESVKETTNDIKGKVLKGNGSVFEYIRNNSQSTIVAIDALKKALIFKAEKSESDPFISVRDIATSYGILIDKEIALKKLDLAERTFTLKEREVEHRISNPELYGGNVTIVNDLPGGDGLGSTNNIIKSDSTPLS